MYFIPNNILYSGSLHLRVHRYSSHSRRSSGFFTGPRCPLKTPSGFQQKSLFFRLDCCPLLAMCQSFKRRLAGERERESALLNVCTFPFHRSNWLKPCCGRRVALWQVCLLSAGFNCVLVACVILVVLFLSLELLIDTKLLQCKYRARLVRFIDSDLR